MSTQIFVNLPVRDLAAAKAFYLALGYDLNPKFSDDNAACIVISESIAVMLLVHPFFKGFIRKDICDTGTHTEAILCLSADSRDQVDALIARALAAGGSEPMPAQDHGFMYGRSFNDVDGHHWEVVHMDPGAMP